MKAWVLWHRYSDGSSAHVERVYLDAKRAAEDIELLNNQPGALGEWRLDECPVVGAMATP